MEGNINTDQMESGYINYVILIKWNSIPQYNLKNKPREISQNKMLDKNASYKRFVSNDNMYAKFKNLQKKKKGHIHI